MSRARMGEVLPVFREGNKYIILLEISHASTARVSGKHCCKIEDLTRTEKVWRRFLVL